MRAALRTGIFGHAWSGARGADLSFIARALLTAAVGTLVGLWLTSLVVHGSFPFGAVRVGPWTAFPTIGSPTIDPYARAILSVSAFAPIGSDEGVAFFAERDSDGGRLDGRCDYVLETAEPAARFWSLALFDTKGRAFDNVARRYALTSQEIVRIDRSTIISVGRDIQSGNWLPSPEGPFVLMLSLYEANSGTATAAAADMVIPTIRRGTCRR